MIHIDVVQGTTEWAQQRIGIVTASAADKIITPTGKPSSQAEKYAWQLLAEQLLGEPLDNATSGFMQRGTILEQRAVDFYELQKDVDTIPAGFVLRDDRRVGASPDRLIGSDGLLEIKIPKADTHIGYLLDSEGIGYRAQVQTQLWVCERTYCDTLSWHPELPPALVRQHRDEKFIAALAAAVEQFNEMLDEAKEKLQKQFGLFPGWQRRLMKVVA